MALGLFNLRGQSGKETSAKETGYSERQEEKEARVNLGATGRQCLRKDGMMNPCVSRDGTQCISA